MERLAAEPGKRYVVANGSRLGLTRRSSVAGDSMRRLDQVVGSVRYAPAPVVGAPGLGRRIEVAGVGAVWRREIRARRRPNDR